MLPFVHLIQIFFRHVFYCCFGTALASSAPPHQCLHRSVSSFWDMTHRISESLTPVFLYFFNNTDHKAINQLFTACKRRLRFTAMFTFLNQCWSDAYNMCSLTMSSMCMLFKEVLPANLHPNNRELQKTASQSSLHFQQPQKCWPTVSSFQSCQKVSAVSHKVF